MNREDKAKIIDELTEKLNQTSFFYITDASGFSVENVNAFRKACYEKGVEYKVIKNSLIKKALERMDADYTPFYEGVLKGFSGIIFSPESNNLPAKLLKEFRKKGGYDRPLLKGASIDSSLFIGEENLETLITLKSKNELIGEVIGLLQSPVNNVVGALLSGKHTIAGLVKTLSDKKE